MLGAATAIASAIFVTPRPAAPAPAPSIDTAAPQLVLFRRNRDTTVEVLIDGTDAQPGDLVQAAYLAAGNVHGVIVSFDGDGDVTLHYPDEPDETTQLRPRGMTPLDHSFELDDAHDFERFVFVSARDHDIDVSTVLQAATDRAHSDRALDRNLALPTSWMQTSFVLRKPPSDPHSDPTR
jgi:hypothetical protein